MELDYPLETIMLPHQKSMRSKARHGKVAPLVRPTLHSQPSQHSQPQPPSEEEILESAIKASLLSYEQEQFERDADAKLEEQFIAMSIKTAIQEADARILDMQLSLLALEAVEQSSGKNLAEYSSAKEMLNEWKATSHC